MHVKFLTLDPELIADGLQISEEAVMDDLSDGRWASPYGKRWAERLFGPDIKVHMLTDRVRFQRNINAGGKRPCTMGQLRRDVENSLPKVVVDVQHFPSVVLIGPIPVEQVLAAEAKGLFNENGMMREAFYQEFAPDFAYCV